MYNVKKLNAISKVVYDTLKKDDYLVSSHIEDHEADAFLVRSANCHDMPLSPRLLAFARAGAGVNNIPIDRCTDQGIAVFNTPGANANAVKELVLCSLLLASRNVLEGVLWAKSLLGEGDEVPSLVEKGKNKFVGPELMGKTIGIIGLGAIGVMVANACAAIGMNVIGYDPFISIDNAWHLSLDVHKAKSFDYLLEKSDFITIHVPFMEKTKDYLSSPEFSKMKDGVIVLNFSRGGLVRSSSITEALDKGKVAKYVTDFPDEHMLMHKKVISIPHLGASTPESEDNCASMAASELKSYLETGSIKNSVNLPSCQLAAPEKGVRLTVIHKNLPNMVSPMTSILADARLNIEEMVNKSRDQVAYTVFDLNQNPSDEIIEKFMAIDGVIKVRRIV